MNWTYFTYFGVGWLSGALPVIVAWLRQMNQDDE